MLYILGILFFILVILAIVSLRIKEEVVQYEQGKQRLGLLNQTLMAPSTDETFPIDDYENNHLIEGNLSDVTGFSQIYNQRTGHIYLVANTLLNTDETYCHSLCQQTLFENYHNTAFHLPINPSDAELTDP